MPKRNTYYPLRYGDQIVWLRNFRSKLPNYEAALNYQPQEVVTVLADCDLAIYLLGTYGETVRTFGLSATAAAHDLLDGEIGGHVDLPGFTLPNNPPPPTGGERGILRRIFAFVANLKTRPGYNDGIGEDLGIIGTASAKRGGAPEPKGEARSGEVVLTFKKGGHMGVHIEGQVGNETTWQFLATDTASPYNDTRPLATPNQPEVRRYRMCYWDGTPTFDWSNTVNVVYGG